MPLIIRNARTTRPVRVHHGFADTPIYTTGNSEQFEISGEIHGKGSIRAMFRALERANGRPVNIKVTLAKEPKKRRRERSKR